jgi:diaminopimelate decarboxylase
VNASPPQPHPTVASYPVADGVLMVGGIPIDRLAQVVGRTPFFAYDRTKLTDRMGELRRLLPRRIDVSYAIKANPMPAVVQHLRPLVDGFDVASAGELLIALDTGMPADRISFAGPGKRPDELTQAVAAGVTVEMESETEARRLIAIGDELGIRPRVAIRVNPDFQVKGSGMRMGGGPQQFGIDSERVPVLLKELAIADLDFLGFHIFAGSQNLRADILCEAQRRTVELAVALADDSPLPVRCLNLGGGFGIPYGERDEALDVAAIGVNLAELIDRLVLPKLPDARVSLELGRFLVGEAGIYVTRVVDRKESRGKVFLVVDGGLHHQLAASGNFGQVIRRNYPVAIGNRLGTRSDARREVETEITSVVGALCTPLDLLADGVELPPAEIGDLVVIFQAGAYGLTASPTAFLSHPFPPEVLV